LGKKLVSYFGMEFKIVPFLQKHDNKQIKNTRKCIPVDKITLSYSTFGSPN